jgi:hypothetical protein
MITCWTHFGDIRSLLRPFLSHQTAPPNPDLDSKIFTGWLCPRCQHLVYGASSGRSRLQYLQRWTCKKENGHGCIVLSEQICAWFVNQIIVLVSTPAARTLGECRLRKGAGPAIWRRRHRFYLSKPWCRYFQFFCPSFSQIIREYRV